MRKKYLRSFEEASNSLIVMLSGEGLGFDIVGSKRRKALIEVLRRIPEDEFQKLTEAFESGYTWFIPDYSTRGSVRPFFATVYPEGKEGSKHQLAPYAPIVYLSPVLETSAWDIVVAVIAHELAHIALGHTLMTQSVDEYDAQEDAVFNRLCEWEFEREAKKHRSLTQGET